MSQLSMFDGPALPPGFKYRPGLITPGDENVLLENIRTLPFKEFEFHGYTGKRRVVSFGWHYDFSERELQKTEDIPSFLLDLRAKVALFAEMPAAQLQHVLVTEYDVGAAIGWHRDKAVFGEVLGISLLAPCTFRLRKKTSERASEDSSIRNTWERVSITAEPRSCYLLSGPARTEWEHSIPPVDALRYSITYRNLKE